MAKNPQGPLAIRRNSRACAGSGAGGKGWAQSVSSWDPQSGHPTPPSRQTACLCVIRLVTVSLNLDLLTYKMRLIMMPGLPLSGALV